MNAEPLQKEQGSIFVNTENIFPIIKRSLYSDHEIFLRELISNGLDATQKVKYLSSAGEYQGELGELNITVKIDKEAKTLTISDKGIGMTGDEVRKYINQVAFSGAEEFVKKFKDAGENQDIIGRFGLGFYSAFMVSSKVEIITKSYQDAEAVRWECDGSTSYTLEAAEKAERGTDIVLHIDADSEEFLEDYRIRGILTKYFKFIPTPIIFEEETINPVAPLWKKSPTEIQDQEYIDFFHEIHPGAEDPLFWIHLNIDYPFNLTGILYFPQIKKEIDPNRSKIQLYCRQVFITDEVKDIVPDYLMLLQGVIDSPDIPLNVSRSYLQSDANVKKISSYISRKVADKLQEIFRDDRPNFEAKWKDISLFVKYGMIADEKFYERAEKFFVVENTEHKFFTMDEYKDFVAYAQTDKDGKLVHLYSNNPDQQDLFVKTARAKGYDVLIMDGFLDSHLIGNLERKVANSRWARIDSDTVDKLIPKADAAEEENTLSEEETTGLKTIFGTTTTNPNVEFHTQALGEEQMPVTIIRPEFMRRMQEMQQTGGGMYMGFSMPETLKVMINTTHPLVKDLAVSKDEKMARHLYDLALLAQDMLKGKDLSEFIQRTVTLVK